MHQRRRLLAHSLAELLLVLAIVAVLAGAITLSVSGLGDEARRDQAREELCRIRDAVRKRKLAIPNVPPRSLLDVPDLDPREPVDPWGSPYVYQPGASRVVSAGPDGTLQTADGAAAVGGDDLAESVEGREIERCRTQLAYLRDQVSQYVQKTHRKRSSRHPTRARRRLRAS